MTDRSFHLRGNSGRGVLVIHGLTGVPAEMKYLARKLNRAGFSICAPQLAGHGSGKSELLRTTWHDWLASVRRAYAAFRQEVSDVFVAGICVGGALGLELAAEQPGIRAAAVYSMTFEYDGWNMRRWYSRYRPALQRVANLPGLRRLSFKEPYPFGLKDEWLRDLVTRATTSPLEGALDRLPLGSLYQMQRLGQHLEAIAPALQVPTLILHAREDDMSDPRNAERLRDLLGGPVELDWLADSYHMIHLDKQRDYVAERTAGFFNAAAQRAVGTAPAPGETRDSAPRR